MALPLAVNVVEPDNPRREEHIEEALKEFY